MTALSLPDGTQFIELPRYSDERGTVLQFMSKADPHFAGFGELYFSTVYQGVVKAWKKHATLTASYGCVHGGVKMVLYDARSSSRFSTHQ